MSKSGMPKLLKPALLAGALVSLGACTYDGVGFGAGYSSGYDAGYNCDPYAPFDDYYACDDGYGYANIGFGGGWYDNYYYPGYGRYIFDNRGSRHAMKHKHRRYWAHRRAQHGTRHARRGEGHRGDYRGGRRYRDEARGVRGRDLTPEQRAERRERRADRRAGRVDRRGDGMRGQRRNGQAGNMQRRSNRGPQAGAQQRRSMSDAPTRPRNPNRVRTNRGGGQVVRQVPVQRSRAIVSPPPTPQAVRGSQRPTARERKRGDVREK